LHHLQDSVVEAKNPLSKLSPITSAFRSLQSFVRATSDSSAVTSFSKPGKNISKNSNAPSTSFSARCVTREEYLEGGTNTCRKKFSQNWELGFDLGGETKSRNIDTVSQTSHEGQKTLTLLADNEDGDGEVREGGMDEDVDVNVDVDVDEDDNSIVGDEVDDGKRRTRSATTSKANGKRSSMGTSRRGKGSDRGKGGKDGGNRKARGGLRTRRRVGSSSVTKEATKVVQ